jgi:hypothetical protein
MAYIKLSIGQTGITQHLLIVLRKTTDPLSEYARQSFEPTVPATINFTFEDIDPAVYHIDYRNSPDGEALGTLLGTFQQDATKTNPVIEMRFYKVGSGVGNAPEANTDELSDPYLDGKDFVIFKEGFRPLVPPIYDYKEYNLLEGGGVKLLNDAVWGDEEVIAIMLVNMVPATAVSSGGILDVVDLTASATLGSSHYNKRINCESESSSLMSITLDVITNYPDKTAFKFTSNGGAQTQVGFVPVGGSFLFRGESYLTLWLNKGDSMTIQKRVVNSVARWDVFDAPHLIHIGEIFFGIWKDHPNTLVLDGTANLSGDEYPGLWWWLNTKLPLDHKIVNDAIAEGSAPKTAGKEGLFAIHTTDKIFGLPNYLGYFIRNIDSLVYGTHTERTYDYPGGSQAEAVKNPGNISGGVNNGNPRLAVARRNGSGGRIDGFIAGGGNAPGPDNFDDVAWPYTGVETRPVNLAVVPLIRY